VTQQTVGVDERQVHQRKRGTTRGGVAIRS
jgi:hypothetical protein